MALPLGEVLPKVREKFRMLPAIERCSSSPLQEGEMRAGALPACLPGGEKRRRIEHAREVFAPGHVSDSRRECLRMFFS